MRPDISSLDRPIRDADRKFPQPSADTQALLIGALAENYRRNPPPATFRAIVSPLVSWIWIGGAIVLLGALVAAWPSPEARLRRVRSLYSARAGQGAGGPRAPRLRAVEYGLALIFLVAVVTLIVVRPVVYREDDEADVGAARAELEAAKEAKYREIRDAELDRQMGKLTAEDHRAIDRELRAEAIEILRRLDELEGDAGAPRLA